MRREDLTARFAEYERRHRVQEYLVHGVDVWPLVRIGLGLQHHADDASSDAGGRAATSHPTFAQKVRIVGGFLGTLTRDRVVAQLRRRGLGQLVRREPPAPDSGRRDAVLMTSSNRAIPFGDEHYHPIVDPIAERIRARGQTCVIWENGPPVGRATFPVPIRDRLPSQVWLEHRKRDLPAAWPRPPWFPELAAWARRDLGSSLTWDAIEHRVRNLLLQSRVLERWLAQVSCRLLLLDCWYSAYHTAACLAASRLGVVSVDVQHGLQGTGHFAYAGWTRAPEGGYALLPQRFWVWGESDRTALCENNPGVIGPGQVIVGGNPWINRWRGRGAGQLAESVAAAKSVASGYDNVLLVTVQKAVDYEADLRSLLARSPRDWLWLVRLRQDMRDQVPALTRRLREAGHPGVNVVDATRLPLFALFQAATTHLTWYSTCAVEALAFGVPTVLLHPSGRAAFSEYVDAGVMQMLPGDGDLETALRACEQAPPARLVEAGQSSFAPDAALDDALAKLLVED